MRKSALALLFAFAAGTTSAMSQGWQSQTVPAHAPPPPKSRPAQAAPASAPQAQRAAYTPQTSPVQSQIQFLVRTSLLALNDANRTGNYTVLRDLAAPSLREKNSAADLALVFTEMRKVNLDLSAAALMAPELDEQPSLDADRRLRLKGYYPTEPNRIAFELIYEAVNGHWLLHSVSISTRPSRTAAGGVAAPPR